MSRAMNMTLMTDITALHRNRARASDMLWQDMARDEAQDRLSVVNKSFTDAAVVTDFSHIWPEYTAVPMADTLALGSHDLVIHAMGLHWANDPVGQLVQCRRALRPDGLLIAVMFGGQTLTELRASLAQAESEITGGLSPRVLPMGEIRDLGGLLQRAGFALPVADSFTKTALYRDMFHLMRDLRAFGEASALAARPRHFTRTAILNRANDIYRANYGRDDGLIPATFEVICLTGWAPHEDQQKPLRPGSAAARLEDALNGVRQKDS